MARTAGAKALREAANGPEGRKGTLPDVSLASLCRKSGGSLTPRREAGMARSNSPGRAVVNAGAGDGASGQPGPSECYRRCYRGATLSLQKCYSFEED
jgi:hypothetical protein